MSRIVVRLGPRSYPIDVTRQGYQSLGAHVRRMGLGPIGIIVTNRAVRRIAGRQVTQSLRRVGWRVTVLEVPDTERAKSIEVSIRLARRLLPLAKRHTPTLLALGGGVVGDVTGFVASIFRRGVPYIQLPTTLLAQVDAAIGGKVGIDLPQGKNLLGAFYQPRLVLCNVHALRTLPQRQLLSGLAEVIKYGAIADRVLWARLEQQREAILRAEAAQLAWIVTRCARIKARVIARDERDMMGARAILNFGHTVGHALEAAYGYSRRVTHGEAIALGMVAALNLGVQAGITPQATRARVVSLLAAYGLPTRTRRLAHARVVRAMQFDKKFIGGQQRWVMLRGIGQATIVQGARRLRDALHE